MTNIEKCQRCRKITAMKTRLGNVDAMRARDVDLGGDNLVWIDAHVRRLRADRDMLLEEKCGCRELSQLPLSNTGVKISAFSAGIAQKAAKIS